MGRTWGRLFRRWWNLLAVIQVALGAAAVAAIGSAVLPILWQAQRGSPLFVVRFMQDEFVSPADEADGNEPPVRAHRILSQFEPEDGARLMKALPQVVRAAGNVKVAWGVAIEAAGRRYLVNRAAQVPLCYLELADKRLVAGGFFTEQDTQRAGADANGLGQSVVISQALARILFGSAPAVGQQIAIRPNEEAALAQGQPLPMRMQAVRAPDGSLRSEQVRLSPEQIQAAAPVQTATVIGVIESPAPGTGIGGMADLDAALLLPLPAGGQAQGRPVGGPPSAGAGNAATQPRGSPPAFSSSGDLSVRVRAGVPTERAKQEITAYFTPILRQREAEQQRLQPGRGPVITGGGVVLGSSGASGVALAASRSTAAPAGAGADDRGSTPGLSAAYVSIEQPEEWVARAAVQGGLYMGIMAFAAVLVSGIAVFTVTLVNLSEQRREIGLLRALGATRGRVLRGITGEALALVGLGAGLGVLLSEPISRYLLRPMLWMSSGAAQDGWHLTPYLDLRAAAFTFLLALGVGAVAAIYPGWEAARMRPVEAFRDEG